MRKFVVPAQYQSKLISLTKQYRAKTDPKRRDFSPTELDFGTIKFKLARHFGFCYGVEQAVDIAYRAIEENPDKRIFLLSEIIHNPLVNKDLQERGVQYLMSTCGDKLIDFSSLNKNDIVIVPAFGTTVEIQKEIALTGVDVYQYNATCPFVEKVWKRSSQLGQKGYTVIVHGKKTHEETRATFSHSKESSPTVVIFDMEEAKILASFIKDEISTKEFFENFGDSCSVNFSPENDLKRIGVINQTTMLATETKAIAEFLKKTMVEVYGGENLEEHFSDTSDTLCYATNENQSSVINLVESEIDLALVIGGFNSSNTTHLLELTEKVVPSYFIRSSQDIHENGEISHFDIHEKKVRSSHNWLENLPSPIKVAITSGASCPDSIIEEVIEKVASFVPNSKSLAQVSEEFELMIQNC